MATSNFYYYNNLPNLYFKTFDELLDTSFYAGVDETEEQKYFDNVYKRYRILDEIEYAVLENNGNLSTFLYDNKKIYPMPLIIDGVIQYDTLNDINKNGTNFIVSIIASCNISNILFSFFI